MALVLVCCTGGCFVGLLLDFGDALVCEFVLGGLGWLGCCFDFCYLCC